MTDKEVKMTQFKVGDRVRLTTSIIGLDSEQQRNLPHWLRQSSNGEGVIVGAGCYNGGWDIRWDCGGVNVYPYQVIVLCDTKAKTHPTTVMTDVVTLDPYQFAKFYSPCDAWKKICQQKTWVGAWKSGMEKHGGAKEMCEWLKAKGGNCVCGKGYASWKKEAERVLGVKLVDHRSFIERVFRRKK